MAGMPGEILDQKQVDKAQADLAGAGVHVGVVEFEVGGDHAGTLAGALEFGDHVGQRFAVSDNKTAVATGGLAVACGFVEAEQGTLEPDALGGCGVLISPIGVVSEATRRRRTAVSDSPRVVSMSACRLRSSMLSSMRRSGPVVIRGSMGISRSAFWVGGT